MRTTVPKKTVKKEVAFQLAVEPGSKVFVAGTFNNWDPAKHPMQDNPDSGRYRTSLDLSPGRHEYKFVVDGEWRIDPDCAAWAQNDQGSLNSVISVE